MAELKGTQVAASIVPFTDLDTYATHDAEYGKGGFRSVSTIEDRDAIPVERKTEGMIVRVTANGLNYEWKNNAWVEWLPKGNIVIDTSLSENSANPVQNKVIATRVNTLENSIVTILEQVNNIPIITVDTVWNATSNNPASSKAIESTISPIRTTANLANSKADSALGTAHAAIPKSYIDTALSEDASDARVPSSKLLKNLSGFLSLGLQNVQSSADSAYDKANAAIPKSKIDTSIDGTETAHDAVPSVAATVTYVKSQRTAIDGSINSVSGRVTTLETWKNGIGNKNQANGVAGLDASGKVPSSQLPSYVDDIVDVTNFVTSNPTSGMTIGNVYYNSTTKKLFTATSATAGVTSDPKSDKIYVRLTDSTLWRWSGSTMAQVNGGLVLGTTSTTAFRGDYGNTLYTNFGSGDRLAGTQDARDFFIRKEGKEFIQSIIVSRNATLVKVSASGYDFDLVSKNNTQTILAADAGNAGVMTAEMYKTLREIELATFPLSLTASGGGTWEVGSSTTTGIAISVLRKGVNVTANSTIQVTASSGSGSLSSNKSTWTPSAAITSNTSVEVKATYGSQTATKTASYAFKYKKYWGTSASATLTNANILALTGQTWADSRAMNATKFDCTGGKYPYYVIPASIYTGLEVWVGGLKNTDIVVSDITLTNASGASAAYKVIRLANKQTGVLSIQFK